MSANGKRGVGRCVLGDKSHSGQLLWPSSWAVSEHLDCARIRSQKADGQVQECPSCLPRWVQPGPTTIPSGIASVHSESAQRRP